MNLAEDLSKMTGAFRVIVTVAFAIGLLFAANSTINLLRTNTVYPISGMRNSFLPNDYINLFFGVPILFVSAFLTLRGNKIGNIGLAGSLLFVLYNEIAYLFAVRNIYSVIMNATIVLLGTAAIVFLFRISDYQGILHTGLPIRHPKAYGAILILMGLVFVARAAVNMVGMASGNAVLPQSDIGVNIADLLICPLWIISGILLFRESVVGYFVGFISYLHGSMLFIALMAFMVIQPVLCGTGFVAADFIVIMAMSLAFLVPLMLLVRRCM